MKKLLIVIVSIMMIGAVNAQSKIAHMNSNAVLDTLPSRKKAMTELQDLSKAAQKELSDAENDLNTSYDKYMKERETLSQVLRQYEEERLTKKQTDLQNRQQELQQKIQQRNDELNAPILKLLQQAVENVAARKKLEYVVDDSQLLYSKGGVDITNEVMEEALKMDKQSATSTTITTPKK